MKIVCMVGAVESCVGGTYRHGKDGVPQVIISYEDQDMGRGDSDTLIYVEGGGHYRYDSYKSVIKCDDGTFAGENDAFLLVPKKE